MDNNNPAEMTNADLEKDAQQRRAQSETSGNQENINKSTAAEGTLKTPDQDQSSVVKHHTAHNSTEEQDLDDLVHRQAEETDAQDGSLPDPEDDFNWEDDDDNYNKISS